MVNAFSAVPLRPSRLRGKIKVSSLRVHHQFNREDAKHAKDTRRGLDNFFDHFNVILYSLFNLIQIYVFIRGMAAGAVAGTAF